MAETIEIQLEDDFFGMDWYDPTCYASEILDAKYEKVHVDDVIDQLDHLNAQQKNNLKRVLNEHTKVFDGTLGVYPHRKFHIESQEQCQSTLDNMLYQLSIWEHPKRVNSSYQNRGIVSSRCQ
jgi:hypothetical protein